MVERTFELPDLGEGIAEGELVSWLVDEGESVVEDQVIAEVETDKALVEIPSPQEGTVAKLHYDESEIVPVDAVFVTFDVAGDAEDAGGSEPAGTADSTASEADAEPTEPSATTEAESSAGSEVRPGESDDAPVPSGRVFAAPSTRSLARELGVDLAAVEGSGPGGRVTGADVRAHAGDGGSPEAAVATDAVAATGATADGTEPAATAAPADAAAAESTRSDEDSGAEPAAAAAVAPTATDRDRTLAMPATRRLGEELGVDFDTVPASEEREGEPFVTPEDVERFAAGDSAGAAVTSSEAAAAQSDASTAAPSGEAGAAGATADAGGEPAVGDAEARSGERVPYRGVRRTIGEQMAESKYTAPHVSHHDEFDATELVELRTELAAIAEDEGVKLTYLPLVVKAVTTALQEHPYLNSSLDEEHEEIVLHDEYNVGIAVSTDAGLMVPVIDNADEKGLKQLADEIQDLAERARNRKIKPEEMRGGTFTITNIGVIGGEFSSPIINHPEAAIFAMGPIKERPWVVDGDVVARETMRFSMSVDHRLVDGADAAQFSNRVKELLVEPSRLLLE
ncbi:dihydrolipoamide acetyltransferase family protein [Halobellus litoreus]|uniref:Dihydrolipoamide acetyltransferase family protein n=1 Tax=Halobellus litoreus TaxID=755310 RepID=A0ABD6DX06_9EURY